MVDYLLVVFEPSWLFFVVDQSFIPKNYILIKILIYLKTKI